MNEMNETKEFPKIEKFLDGNHLRFQKYGVSIEIQSAKIEHLRRIFAELEKTFPNGLETAAEIEYRFVINILKNGWLELNLNGEEIFKQENAENFFGMLESRLRITIAEFAVGKVFLHAGVVGWGGQAIIIPATSFAGKTTLVAELVKKGAMYYSDEYAVLDADGSVEPFPKWLSMRGIVDEWTQVERPVESIGGVAAVEPIPVGMVLLAEYRKGRKIPKKWQPRRLKPGTATLEIIQHTIPIRNNPKFVLEVLNKLTNRAIIVKTVRGEAAEFAEPLLGYFDSQTKRFNI